MDEIKICKCCEKKAVPGHCIINGVKRNLTNICRYCFIRNPENRELGKRNKSKDYYRYHIGE